jgi:hypothetical protein
MRGHLFIGAVLAVTVGTSSCQDQRAELMAPFVGTGPELARQATGRYKVDRDHMKLPASVRIRDQHFADAVLHAIDPNDFVCPPSTPFFDWFLEELDEVISQEPEIIFTLFDLAADVVPIVDAIVFETEATPQYFGYTGEYTHILTKTERDVKRFWDISSGDIQLIGLHGTMLQDIDRVARTYELAFGIPHDQAVFLATLVRDVLLQSQLLDGGNHPIFSTSAFAVETDGASIPNKIIIGDGIVEGFKVLGLDDVAPQAFYAHEFAHHIQAQKGYFDDPLHTTGDPEERTRYRELMADAFSAYYLTHKRGAALNRKRVEQFLEVFFDIGDCAFTHPNHHGTPNQRMRAAHFGFDVADQAQKQGHILTADQFHELFVAAYEMLIAPDAT